MVVREFWVARPQLEYPHESTRLLCRKLIHIRATHKKGFCQKFRIFAAESWGFSGIPPPDVVRGERQVIETLEDGVGAPGPWLHSSSRRNEQCSRPSLIDDFFGNFHGNNTQHFIPLHIFGGNGNPVLNQPVQMGRRVWTLLFFDTFDRENDE